MQDRFKFRVWDDTFQIMEYEADLALLKGQLRMYSPFHVIMQCTGLKDKNGKLIYEGDIVKYDDTEIGGTKGIGQVQWDDTYEIGPFMSWSIDLERPLALGMEVIGNIYEHTELIEK